MPNLDPGENGNITQVNDSYLNYPLYATRQALRSLITPDAQATARNTPMQPMIDTVVSLAMNIRNRVDMMLWWLMIIQGLHQETGQVTTVENLDPYRYRQYMGIGKQSMDPVDMA